MDFAAAAAADVAGGHMALAPGYFAYPERDFLWFHHGPLPMAATGAVAEAIATAEGRAPGASSTGNVLPSSMSLSSLLLIDAVKHLSFDDSFVCDSFLAHDSRLPLRFLKLSSLTSLPQFEFISFTLHSLSASVALYCFLVFFLHSYIYIARRQMAFTVIAGVLYAQCGSNAANSRFIGVIDAV